MKTDAATLKRVDAMSLAGVYPHYVDSEPRKVEHVRQQADGNASTVQGDGTDPF
jgi:hypothetical protein